MTTLDTPYPMPPLSPLQESRLGHVLEALRLGLIDRAEAVRRLQHQLGFSRAEAEAEVSAFRRG